MSHTADPTRCAAGSSSCCVISVLRGRELDAALGRGRLRLRAARRHCDRLHVRRTARRWRSRRRSPSIPIAALVGICQCDRELLGGTLQRRPKQRGDADVQVLRRGSAPALPSHENRVAVRDRNPSSAAAKSPFSNATVPRLPISSARLRRSPAARSTRTVSSNSRCDRSGSPSSPAHRYAVERAKCAETSLPMPRASAAACCSPSSVVSLNRPSTIAMPRSWLRPRDVSAGSSSRPGQLDRLGGRRPRRGQVSASVDCCQPCREQHTAAKLHLPRGQRLQPSLEPFPHLPVAAVRIPEVDQRGHDPKSGGRLAVVERPGHRLVALVSFRSSRRTPSGWVLCSRCGAASAASLAHPVRVAPSDCCTCSAVFRQPLQRVLAHALQHPQAAVPPRPAEYATGSCRAAS